MPRPAAFVFARANSSVVGFALFIFLSFSLPAVLRLAYCVKQKACRVSRAALPLGLLRKDTAREVTAQVYFKINLVRAL